MFCIHFISGILQQQPVVLTNPFQHGKNLTQASTSTEGGSQGPPLSSSNPLSANVYMMKGDAYISTRAHDYGNPSTSEKGKEDKIHLFLSRSRRRWAKQ
jgi:hypothetical protein